MSASNHDGVLRLFRSVGAGRQWLRSVHLALHSPSYPGGILMRPGDEEPPVFIIPGASGSVLEIGPLVSRLTIATPVYATTMKGLKASEVPFARIEDIAAYCIDNITAISPHGPYLLVGYSLGGVIALEIAHRLELAGNLVPLVVLLESYPSEKIWPLACHVDILKREIYKSLGLIKGLSLRESVRHIAGQACGLANYLLRMTYGLSYLAPAAPDQVSVAARSVYLATLNALKRYRPPAYAGKVVFIETLEKNALDPGIPQKVWQKYLSNFEVRRVPGSHLTIIEADAATTAMELSSLIASVRSGSSGANDSVPERPDLAVGKPTNLVAALYQQKDCETYPDVANSNGYQYLEVIDEICKLPWKDIDHDDVMKIAKVYYYFSIQFRENLRIACLMHPKDQMLQKLDQGECNTDNLSPWPGVAKEGEKLNHDEFMNRLLSLEQLDHLKYLDDIGSKYLQNIRELDDTTRAASIATYEDGGLSRVFSAILRAPQWQGAGQRAFKFFLEEHIRFDMDVDNGHGALARHLRAGDDVVPLWVGFKEILLAAVPKLGVVSPMSPSLSAATTET
jgi:thioesterase domain-containing protein